MWGPGRTPSPPKLLLCGLTLPEVDHYKYMGIWVSASGSWTRHLTHMREKAINKTGEIIGWCKLHQATLDIATALWDLYVARAVLFGAALLVLTDSGAHELDRI